MPNHARGAGTKFGRGVAKLLLDKWGLKTLVHLHPTLNPKPLTLNPNRYTKFGRGVAKPVPRQMGPYENPGAPTPCLGP